MAPDRQHARAICRIARSGYQSVDPAPCGMDLLAVALCLVLTSWFGGDRKDMMRRRATSYAKVAVPVYAVFVLLDRAYQYYRFGSFFTTYIGVFGREQKMLNPALPAAFPFETPFHVGFLGALITPEKSIFLFDPLLVLTAIIAVVSWKRFRPEIKAYLIAFVVLLFVYISFYAKYTDWSGDHRATTFRPQRRSSRLFPFRCSCAIELAQAGRCGVWG